MTPLNHISQPQVWILAGIQLIGLSMFIIVWLQWRKRRIAGFSFGESIRTCPLGWGELGQLTALLLLVYSLFLWIGLVLGKLGALRNDSQQVLFLVVCQTLLYLFLLAFVQRVLWHKGETWSRVFGLQSTSFKNVLVTSAVALGAILLPLQLIAWGVHSLFEALQWPMEPQAIIQLLSRIRSRWLQGALVALAVVGAPALEEIFFRGLLYPQLKLRFGFVHALWINSALFAVFHLHVPSAIPLFALGIAFTLLYEWRGNLSASILFHTGFNSLSLILLFTLKDSLS